MVFLWAKIHHFCEKRIVLPLFSEKAHIIYIFVLFLTNCWFAPNGGFKTTNTAWNVKNPKNPSLFAWYFT